MINNDWQALGVGLLDTREIARIVASNTTRIDLPMWQIYGLASNSNTNEKTERCSSQMGISCKDRVTNEEVRVRIIQQNMDDILSERRFRWLGHVIRMDLQSIP